MLGPILMLGAAQAAAPPTEYVVPPTRCYASRGFAIERTEGQQRLRIAGSITQPRRASGRPTVVMITGSGDHVRDQMISGVPMFGMIADFLARAGYTVVRADARGYGGSTVDGANLRGPQWVTVTSAQRYADSRHLVDYVARDPQLVRGGIVLLGHSEGAMIASRLAADREDIALTVMLANSTAPGHEVFVRQRLNTARRAGAAPEILDRLRPLLYELAAFVTQDPGNDARFEALAARFQQAQAGMAEPLFTRGLLEFHRSRSAWHSWFMAYDPAPDLARLRSPVLAVYGSADDATEWQVHAPILSRALSAAGNGDHAVVVLPDQDHFFLEHEGRRVDRHPYGRTRISNELQSLLLDQFAMRFGAGPAYCSG